MKGKVIKGLKCLLILFVVTLVIGLVFPTWTAKIKGENSISILEKVEINGTEHSIMIRGEDVNNPVLLYVHGGPGVSEIPYVKYLKQFEDKFTVVQYDQRASGKSYHFFEDYADLSTDLLVDDLLEITDYILKRLGKEKVILVGHSFGTYISINAAYRAPTKYEAYVGIGQMSDTLVSEIDSLNFCIEQAVQNGNEQDANYLKNLSIKVESGEILAPREYVRKYGGASRNFDDNRQFVKGLILGSEYNLLDAIRFLLGASKYQNDLIKECIDKPLTSSVTKLNLPFYFVMGRYDYMTTANAAKTYFDMIEADKKEFVTFEDSAHYPQFEEKNKFYEWMCSELLDSVLK